MPSNRLALPSGYRLENYQFTESLGKGGFGITYLARDLQLNRRVAVKELLPDAIATRVNGTTVVAQSEAHEENWSWAKDRFLTEAQVVASFRHPNIVNVHRLIEANGTVYMVMDFLDGGTYEERLMRIGKEADESSLRAVIEPLLDGLEEVHKAGLLHRDIKPDNILFNHRGEPILADFGAARQMIGQTMALTSIVTPGYSPFEQYQSREGLQGAWTDIYAFGAVMARAITGKRPPPATDRLGKDEFEALGSKPRAAYSREFLKAVDLALRMEPRDRPQSVAAWRKTLVPQAKAPEPMFALVSPKTGERWEAGTERKIDWKPGATSGRTSVKYVDVELWKDEQLVEKIATALEAASPGVPWRISTEIATATDYQIKLIARDVDGKIIATCSGGKFAIVPKATLAGVGGSNRQETDKAERAFQFIMAAIILWFIFFGGWKVIWDKAFPHLPQPMISWVREKHPGWVPVDLSHPINLDLNKFRTGLATPVDSSSYLHLLSPRPSPTLPYYMRSLQGVATPEPSTPRGGYFQSGDFSKPPPTPRHTFEEIIRAMQTPAPAPSGAPVFPGN